MLILLSCTVEAASIILCGWNAVAAMGVGRCEESTFVCRKLLKGSMVERGVELTAVEEMLLVEKTRTALWDEPLEEIVSFPGDDS